MAEFGDTMQSGRERTGYTTGRTTHQDAPLSEQAKEKAGKVADQAKDQIVSGLEGGKSRATEGLSGISHALRQTGDNLRSENQGMVADYVEQAAGRIDQLSRYFDQHSVNDLLNEAERFARKEPALFLGGAALLGLLASRFFKSSGSHHDMSYRSNRGYGRGYSASDRYYDPNYARPYRRDYTEAGYRNPSEAFGRPETWNRAGEDTGSMEHRTTTRSETGAAGIGMANEDRDNERGRNL